MTSDEGRLWMQNDVWLRTHEDEAHRSPNLGYHRQGSYREKGAKSNRGKSKSLPRTELIVHHPQLSAPRGKSDTTELYSLVLEVILPAPFLSIKEFTALCTAVMRTSTVFGTKHGKITFLTRFYADQTDQARVIGAAVNQRNCLIAFLKPGSKFFRVQLSV
ncbi:hypothetical protein L218DRAFT_950436 [Marasmius fiardii PR-910]|nr:hypothetical protein L218DRAFT_950436 [Marasmius fiardii PR-910]